MGQNAYMLMKDSSSIQVFRDRVASALQKNSQLIDEWLITNLYMNQNPNVGWFIDEGLTFTIFKTLSLLEQL